MKKTVEDILKEGIYGEKQIKPDERRRFLGTFRERVVLALTKDQVMRNAGLKELEEMMQSHPNTKLLLNGDLDFQQYDKYRELANKQNIHYTLVSNKSFKTKSDIGLLLAYENLAIEKENIFIEEKEEANSEEPLAEQLKETDSKEPRKGISRFFNSLFGMKE
jgi:uncharacterized protein YueI